MTAALATFCSDPIICFKEILARLCLEELGDAFHVFVLGQISYPFHIALEMNIIIRFAYGENGNWSTQETLNMLINLINQLMTG